ncbi:MAG TPA: hypothetical protein DIU28_08765 [Anabaena sp. UBA12330]|nr:hypothetical protein [Anabaena sp. UBA12330]
MTHTLEDKIPHPIPFEWGVKHGFIFGPLSVVRCQLFVVSCSLSVVRCQLSVIRCLLPHDS